MESSTPLSDASTVTIVGGGLAGIACARSLDLCGIGYTLLESSDELGGRIRTTRKSGFTLDLGFQVLLSAYPEVRRYYDLGSLELNSFERGIYTDAPGDTARVEPVQFIAIPTLSRSGLAQLRSLVSGLGAGDLVPAIMQLAKVVGRRSTVSVGDTYDLLPSDSWLRSSVLAPLGGAILLQERPTTPISFARFLLRTVLDGDISLPAGGMAMLPSVLANGLKGVVRTSSTVRSIEDGTVRLDDGSVLHSDAIVVATDPSNARVLLPEIVPEIAMSRIGFLYLASNERILEHKSFYVPSTGSGPLVSLACLSDISPSYSSSTAHLYCAAYRCEPSSLTRVREQLKRRFPPLVHASEVIHGERDALPMRWGTDVFPISERRVSKRTVLAGDYLESPSINGALASGRRAARTVTSLLLGEGDPFDPIPK